jgi:hypothetical protein
MRRRRVLVGAVVLALAAVAVAFWPRGPTKNERRNQRLALADRTVQVGMTAGEVEQLLGCPPDERADGGAVERWTTRGHFGHTVTVWYEGGTVRRVEGRTWRSRPAPSVWDDLRDRLGL